MQRLRTAPAHISYRTAFSGDAIVVWLPRIARAAFLSAALVSGPHLFAQGADPTPLAAAVRLYEGASYAEALQALDRIDAGAAAADERPLVQQYRALCFVALDRIGDAVAALDALVAQFPEYTPGPELPPRVRRFFDESRARVLPDIVRERYAAGRAAYDAGDYAVAVAEFDRVIGFGAMGGRELGDLAVLARGFQDLAREHIENAAQKAPATGAAAADAGPHPPSVTPPAIIDQKMPPWPARVPLDGRRMGMLEIVIGTDGTVARAAMRRSVHPAYDPLLLAAARQWRYTPALRDGQPAAYVKELRIDVGK
jgi:tetratricopeptide (TPR) repeat protein